MKRKILFFKATMPGGPGGGLGGGGGAGSTGSGPCPPCPFGHSAPDSMCSGCGNGNPHGIGSASQGLLQQGQVCLQGLGGSGGWVYSNGSVTGMPGGGPGGGGPMPPPGSGPR